MICRYTYGFQLIGGKIIPSDVLRDLTGWILDEGETASFSTSPVVATWICSV